MWVDVPGHLRIVYVWHSLSMARNQVLYQHTCTLVVSNPKMYSKSCLNLLFVLQSQLASSWICDIVSRWYRKKYKSPLVSSPPSESQVSLRSMHSSLEPNSNPSQFQLVLRTVVLLYAVLIIGSNWKFIWIQLTIMNHKDYHSKFQDQRSMQKS